MCLRALARSAGSLEWGEFSLRARYIPHKDPFDLENTLPLVGRPNGRVLRFINPVSSATAHYNWLEDLRGEHLCDTAKVPRSVHREEQVDWSSPAKLAEGCIETFITEYGGRPDFVFERLLDILFLSISASSESFTHGVRLDDKESRLQSQRYPRQSRMRLTTGGLQLKLAGFKPLLLASSITA
jgi:hypothetical protein